MYDIMVAGTEPRGSVDGYCTAPQSPQEGAQANGGGAKPAEAAAETSPVSAAHLTEFQPPGDGAPANENSSCATNQLPSNPNFSDQSQ